MINPQISEPTTLYIHSSGLIYSPGFFNWIMSFRKSEKARAKKLLLALGIPPEFIKPIMAGEFQKSEEGETLILTLGA